MWLETTYSISTKMYVVNHIFLISCFRDWPTNWSHWCHTLCKCHSPAFGLLQLQVSMTDSLKHSNSWHCYSKWNTVPLCCVHLLWQAGHKSKLQSRDKQWQLDWSNKLLTEKFPLRIFPLCDSHFTIGVIIVLMHELWIIKYLKKAWMQCIHPAELLLH